MKSFSIKQIFLSAFKFFGILFRKYVCKKVRSRLVHEKGGNLMDKDKERRSIELCMKTPLCTQCIRYRVCCDEAADEATSEATVHDPTGGNSDDSKSDCLSEDAN